ncbi:hypothetical protein C1H46_005678 [Malus baccata]|uniref:Uncharacterized protein n=1 Tax=Malus baccata TaxID=106549 RepID=A0A540NCC5_MALBA|nr:hypothetical protein C1H46_005678 [Malus baccata]
MVIKTKSVKYMPFLLSLANFCNRIVWSIYAVFLKLDPYILFPNALGSLSGVGAAHLVCNLLQDH